MISGGLSNTEDKAYGHSAEDSYLIFVDAAGRQQRLLLIDNSGVAHYVKNLQFPDNCPMEPMQKQTCPVLLFYHNLAGGDDRWLKNFNTSTATFPFNRDPPLEYHIDYSDFGGQNNEGKASGHTVKDSHLVFKDATGQNYRISLIDNSGSLCKNSPISPQVCDGSNAHPNVPSHCLLPQFGRW